MQTITHLIEEQAQRRGSEIALIYGAQRFTFAELDDMGRRAARGLRELGVGPGDRVAMWLPNTPAYLALYLGICRLGAISLAVNTRFRSSEVADIVGRSGATVMAMWPGFRQIDFLGILGECEPDSLSKLHTLILYDEGQEAGALPASVAHCRQITYGDIAKQPALDEDAASEEAGCNIFTTSGTTKAPKFVLHSQRSIASHARTVAREFGYAESAGGLLMNLPFCGVFGFCQAMATLASGRPGIISSAFDAGETVRQIDEFAVEYLVGTDDMLEALLDATDRDVALPTVKWAATARFATDFDRFFAKAEKRGMKLVGLYGMSEVQALFAKQPLTTPDDERTFGGGAMVSSEARARTRNPDTGEILPHGEHGELELYGPSLMSEYFLNPEATAETFTEDGFVRTGDLGYTTPDGRFVYLQRMGDVLRLGGFLVSPAEIEGHLLRHPDVADCQVVGIKTERGSRPVGFVITRQGCNFDEAALQAHCLAGLAKFKAPDRIFAIDAFPTTKSANGTKIQRAKLRQMAEDLTRR